MDRDFCSWVLQHLSEYIDREMQSDVCEELEAHLLECPSCRTLHQTMDGTVGMVHDLSQRAIPADCLNRIRERLLKGRGPA
jgi:RNA polymerase sigma-70 factor (ECF subfamily)